MTVKKRSIYMSGLCLLLFVLLMCSVTAAADVCCGADAGDKAIGWYFKKNDDHSIPPLDEHLSYTEQYGAYYADKNAGSDDKRIYLTFDAGYENGNIAKILDVMQQHGIKGSFFVLSHLLQAEPELVRRMAEEGHLVCNHSANHRDMTTLDGDTFLQELRCLEDAYRTLTGKEMAHYFRPPEGKFNRTVLERAQAAGYRTVFWSFAYCDWDNDKQPDPAQSVENILAHTHNGMILLLHPTSATNAQILDTLLSAWEAEGYRFALLDELECHEEAAG